MAIHFNHTILAAQDSRSAIAFLAEDARPPSLKRWGPFEVVTTENGASRLHAGGTPSRRSTTFLTSDEEFDQILVGSDRAPAPLGRSRGRQRQGEISHHDGGRGAYFEDPNGHLLEVNTRLYGSGGEKP